jgi:hypothetical protein
LWKHFGRAHSAGKNCGNLSTILPQLFPAALLDEGGPAKSFYISSTILPNRARPQNLSTFIPQIFPTARPRKIFLQLFHNSSTILSRLEEFGASGLAWGRIVEGIIVDELL